MRNVLPAIAALLLVGGGCLNAGVEVDSTTESKVEAEQMIIGAVEGTVDTEVNVEAGAGTVIEVEGGAEVEANTKAEVIVSITSSGFSPASITVEAGTTVTFVNNDTIPHWPASNPHPVHTTLSAFDSKGKVQPGDSYSYTFTDEGTWKYHCHLRPGLTGEVIVE